MSWGSLEVSFIKGVCYTLGMIHESHWWKVCCTHSQMPPFPGIKIVITTATYVFFHKRLEGRPWVGNKASNHKAHGFSLGGNQHGIWNWTINECLAAKYVAVTPLLLAKTRNDVTYAATATVILFAQSIIASHFQSLNGVHLPAFYEWKTTKPLKSPLRLPQSPSNSFS